MKAKTQLLQANVIVTFRYAVAFGGIVALLLLVANLERAGNPSGMRHHAFAQLSP